jgi:hypothetical protein
MQKCTCSPAFIIGDDNDVNSLERMFSPKATFCIKITYDALTTAYMVLYRQIACLRTAVIQNDRCVFWND